MDTIQRCIPQATHDTRSSSHAEAFLRAIHGERSNAHTETPLRQARTKKESNARTGPLRRGPRKGSNSLAEALIRATHTKRSNSHTPTRHVRGTWSQRVRRADVVCPPYPHATEKGGKTAQCGLAERRAEGRVEGGRLRLRVAKRERLGGEVER